MDYIAYIQFHLNLFKVIAVGIRGCSWQKSLVWSPHLGYFTNEPSSAAATVVGASFYNSVQSHEKDLLHRRHIFDHANAWLAISV